MPLADIISFAADNGFGSIEVMSWPKDSQYGMTHLNVDDVLDGAGPDWSDLLESNGVSIAALTYYSNPLHPIELNTATTIGHIKKMISVARELRIPTINTYAGMNYDKSWDENYLLFYETWLPIVEMAGDAGVNIAIKNSPASFNNGAVRGSNIARSPATWGKMLSMLDSRYFGLDYDPAYMVSQHMDYIKPIYEFADKIKFVQARDVSINKAILDRCGTQTAIDDYTVQEVVGNGCIDWQQVMHILIAGEYKGCVSIDILRRDGLNVMKTALKTSRRVLISASGKWFV